MTLSTLKRALGNIRYALDKAEEAGISTLEKVSNVRDFKAQQNAALIGQIRASITTLEKEARELHSFAEKDSDIELSVVKLLTAVRSIKESDSVAFIKDAIHHIRNELVSIETSMPSPIPATMPQLPLEIRTEAESDLAELRRCFDAGCYRSSVILCGRLLEIALHRKHFEATKIDLMEKAPGTGLGNLIKKLSEAGVLVDPALANQIHVINAVRVNSVHVKKEPFNPSKEQAHAIALYTIDVIKKLF